MSQTLSFHSPEYDEMNYLAPADAQELGGRYRNALNRLELRAGHVVRNTVTSPSLPQKYVPPLRMGQGCSLCHVSLFYDPCVIAQLLTTM